MPCANRVSPTLQGAGAGAGSLALIASRAELGPMTMTTRTPTPTTIALDPAAGQQPREPHHDLTAAIPEVIRCGFPYYDNGSCLHLHAACASYLLARGTDHQPPHMTASFNKSWILLVAGEYSESNETACPTAEC